MHQLSLIRLQLSGLVDHRTNNWKTLIINTRMRFTRVCRFHCDRPWHTHDNSGQKSKTYVYIVHSHKCSYTRCPSPANVQDVYMYIWVKYQIIKRGELPSRRMCSIYCDLKTLNNPLRYVLFFSGHRTTAGPIYSPTQNY